MNRPLSHEQFERIVQETHHQLRAQIAGMGVPADAVDDVAQEVYLDLARQSERVPEGLEIGRWLRVPAVQMDSTMGEWLRQPGVGDWLTMCLQKLRLELIYGTDAASTAKSPHAV